MKWNLLLLSLACMASFVKGKLINQLSIKQKAHAFIFTTRVLKLLYIEYACTDFPELYKCFSKQYVSIATVLLKFSVYAILRNYPHRFTVTANRISILN